MKTRPCPSARVAERTLRIALLAAVAVAAPGRVQGASVSESVSVVRVEEDWELVVDSPDPNNTAPQVTCTIAPTGQLESVYATLEINHQGQPTFVPGGIQLQLWNGDTYLSGHSLSSNNVVWLAGETVRWTQTMTLVDGHLLFAVTHGSSATWGTFDWSELHVWVRSDLPNLNGYDPNVSVQNSGVGFASNRVQSLVLKAVRLVTSRGEVLQDNTLRPVYPRS